MSDTGKKQKKFVRHRIDGWINIDKPVAITSAQLVNKVKKLLRPRKIGHAGTLDPLACGVLPLALGEATKTIPYTMDMRKEYIFTMKFGQQTSTDDSEGEIIAESSVRPTLADIRGVIPEFIGEIEQLPPVYSALKIGGRRACDLARKGEEVTLKPRLVKIYDMTICDNTDTASGDAIIDKITLKVACGKGTYVRSIARDLAIKLGCYAHVIYLNRISVGVFDETNKISLEKLENIVYSARPAGDRMRLLLEEGAILPLDMSLDDIPAVEVNNKQVADIRNGRAIRIDDEALSLRHGDCASPIYRAVDKGSNMVVALMDRKDDDGLLLYPKRVFCYE